MGETSRWPARKSSVGEFGPWMDGGQWHGGLLSGGMNDDDRGIERPKGNLGHGTKGPASDAKADRRELGT